MLKGIVFPSSSTVTLEIINAFSNHKDISIIGVNSHNNYEFKDLLNCTFDDCPQFTDEKNCVNYLINICLAQNCNFIIPTMDNAHLLLSKYCNKFNDNNIKIISSSYETNIICISKETTYNKLKDAIECPIVYNINDIKFYDFPVFLKPKIGYGSRGCHIIKNIEDLNKNYDDNMLIVEYLENEEYTIDCFTHNNKLIYTNVRERVLYKNGLSVITKNIFDDNTSYINNIADQINKTLEFTGSWFFQIKRNKNNKFKLLEVSTRIAGASSINRLIGCNLPLLSVYLHFNYPVEIIKNEYNFTVNKYLRNHFDFKLLKDYNNIYIDLDDTLIVNNKVNTNIIQFIYKSINYDKNIFLITRHKNNVNDTLTKYKIDKNLFTEIYHIIDMSSKSTFINKNSILIDDSYSERKSCIKNNILVFDIDCVEFFN